MLGMDHKFNPPEHQRCLNCVLGELRAAVEWALEDAGISVKDAAELADGLVGEARVYVYDGDMEVCGECKKDDE